MKKLLIFELDSYFFSNTIIYYLEVLTIKSINALYIIKRQRNHHGQRCNSFEYDIFFTNTIIDGYVIVFPKQKLSQLRCFGLTSELESKPVNSVELTGLKLCVLRNYKFHNFISILSWKFYKKFPESQYKEIVKLINLM